MSIEVNIVPVFYKWKAIHPSLIQYTELKSMRVLYKEQG